MTTSKTAETHTSGLNSTSTAKKAKLSLQDIVNNSPGSKPVVQMVHEHWHAANSQVRQLQDALSVYTQKISDIKVLQVQYQKFLEGAIDQDLVIPAEDRMSFLTTALQEISAMEIKSLALLPDFSMYDKDDTANLQRFHGLMADNLQEAAKLHDAVVARLKKNQAWLDTV